MMEVGQRTILYHEDRNDEETQRLCRVTRDARFDEGALCLRSLADPYHEDLFLALLFVVLLSALGWMDVARVAGELTKEEKNAMLGRSSLLVS